MVEPYLRDAKARRPARVDLAPETIAFSPDRPPMLITVVHTEEEFDWSSGFDVGNNSVTHVASIGRFQRIFDDFGIIPTYALDFPIANNESSAEVFRELHASGRAVIGAHLHPWVSPPFDEVICPLHSYPGNLPRSLERRKLELLTERIAKNIGAVPTVYLAGRYGFGPNTADILHEFGFQVDLSPVATCSFSDDGGPDYRHLGCAPFWEGGRPGGLLRIPHTAGYLGYLAAHGRALTDPERVGRIIPRLLARTTLRHVRLTPEGQDLGPLKALTRSLYRSGERVFVLSFHSPSVEPGFTPYVQNNDDLARFLATVTAYLAFFMRDMHGVSCTPDELRQSVLQPRATASSRVSGSHTIPHG